LVTVPGFVDDVVIGEKKETDQCGSAYDVLPPVVMNENGSQQ
jgi:hypothetical protein